LIASERDQYDTAPGEDENRLRRTDLYADLMRSLAAAWLNYTLRSASFKVLAVRDGAAAAGLSAKPEPDVRCRVRLGWR